jgi:hypothetical protein
MSRISVGLKDGGGRGRSISCGVGRSWNVICDFLNDNLSLETRVCVVVIAMAKVQKVRK